MRPIATPDSRLELSRALELMTEALDVLDKLGAPGEISSTLDLAAARLEKYLDLDDLATAGLHGLMSQLERESQASRTIDPTTCPWDFSPFR